MRLPFDLIVLDLELNQPSRLIIEIGAVKLLRNGEISRDNFRAFVRTREPVDKDVSILTGITDTLLEDYGLDFQKAIVALSEWASSETKNICFAGWGGDFHWLLSECESDGVKWPLRFKNYDVKSMVFWASVERGLKFSSDGLGTMMSLYGLEWDSHYGKQHDALADAWNTAKLLQKVWRDRDENNAELVRIFNKLGIQS